MPYVAQWEPVDWRNRDHIIKLNFDTIIINIILFNREYYLESNNITNMFSVDECMNYMATAINPERHVICPNWIVLIKIESIITKEEKEILLATIEKKNKKIKLSGYD